MNNAVDADIAMDYYTYGIMGTPSPSGVINIAIVKDNGEAEYYIVIPQGDNINKTIALNVKVVDCAFSVEDDALYLLCTDGYVYKCNLEDMSAQKMNIGGSNVYIESYMAVNKNGEPRFFRNSNDRCLPSSFKTRMYDELLERID